MWKGFLDGLRSLGKGSESDPWDFSERRSLVRLECQYEVIGRREGQRRTFEGQIVDMGLKGMKLRTFEPLKQGEQVHITYPVPILEIPQDTVVCRVLWVKTRPRDFVLFAGLGYAESDQVMAQSWVKYLLRQLGFSRERIFQKRQSVRAECFVPAQLSGQDGHPVEARLYNLGVGGALVEAAAPWEVGQSVQLQLGPYEGLPRCTLGGRLVSRRPEARRFLHGIEFYDLGNAQLRTLGRYLFFLLRHQWTE